jgi:hypothetical protein
MKNGIIAAAMLTLSLILTGCSSDTAATIDNSVKIKQIMDVAKSGTWHITSFINSSNDETTNFSGYNFTFNSDGTLTATNGSNSINGIWSITEDDDSSDDSSNDNDIDFNISFATPPNFEELSEDWDIVSSNNSKIDLLHVSGGNGGTDTLTFTKN